MKTSSVFLNPNLTISPNKMTLNLNSHKMEMEISKMMKTLMILLFIDRILMISGN